MLEPTRNRSTKFDETRAKEKPLPATILRAIKWQRPSKNTKILLAPSVHAAYSSRRSTASRDKAEFARTAAESPLFAQASAAPVQRKRPDNSARFIQKPAERPVAAEQPATVG